MPESLSRPASGPRSGAAPGSSPRPARPAPGPSPAPHGRHVLRGTVSGSRIRAGPARRTARRSPSVDESESESESKFKSESEFKFNSESESESASESAVSESPHGAGAGAPGARLAEGDGAGHVGGDDVDGDGDLVQPAAAGGGRIFEREIKGFWARKVQDFGREILEMSSGRPLPASTGFLSADFWIRFAFALLCPLATAWTETEIPPGWPLRQDGRRRPPPWSRLRAGEACRDAHAHARKEAQAGTGG